VPTILFVEEDEILLWCLERAFKDTRYTLLCANSATEGLGIWEEHGGRIHALITEIVMQDMDGIELAKALKAKNAFLQVLFLSYSRDVLSKYSGVPANALFEKPFRVADLFQQLEQVFPK
jgi:DNA-binding NtrC family response regulator